MTLYCIHITPAFLKATILTQRSWAVRSTVGNKVRLFFLFILRAYVRVVAAHARFSSMTLASRVLLSLGGGLRSCCTRLTFASRLNTSAGIDAKAIRSSFLYDCIRRHAKTDSRLRRRSRARKVRKTCKRGPMALASLIAEPTIT